MKTNKTMRILGIFAIVLCLVMCLGITAFADGTETAATGNVAKVGNTEYATIDEAIAAWTNNSTLTLLADVTLSDVVKLKSTEHHILDLGTYTMTAASGKNAFEIVATGTGDSERTAITVKADATNPGGINAGSKSIIYYDYSKGTATGNDRPIIKIEGGVFTASTSSWGTAGIYTKGSAARKCATLNISGGTFNCSINGQSKSKLLISGGTFNYSVGSQGDSTAIRLISGGTFKSLGFMTADDNNTKFWFGTSMGNSNVGVYVDDNGYLVVGGDVITEAGETFEASSANYGGLSSYLKYSSAANGLYYTSVEEALADNNKATGSVTVYVNELDMTGISYKGTIVVPEGKILKIKNAPANLKVTNEAGETLTPRDGSYTTVKPQGGSIIGYTSAEGIWGEVWGNASESFEIKVLDANGNVMGTTSLNNIGGIIDGDVTVSWNIKLNAASNTDEYWTMAWTTAPSVKNMPAKVELWVDGTKVSEGNVVLNGPDDLNKIVAAVTDNDGKILSYATTLNAAVAAVEDGGTITLLANETFTANNRTHNSGSWYDGLYYVGDKSFTIDLNGFTIGQNGAVNDYLLNFKNDGSKANTITLKNGTIDAGTAAFCAICTSSTSTQQITINLENINVINNFSNGSTIKVRGDAVLNVNAGTVITGKNSYLGIECVASIVNIYDGAEIYMNGTSSYIGCLVGVCGNGVVNVYGGYGKGVKGGFIAMTSGGTINIYGGEWIANTDGTIGNNSNVYVLTAQNNKYEGGYAGASIINVYGGTFRGGMDAWILNDVNVEKAELNIAGGNFNANPAPYLTEGFVATESNGVYTVVKAVASVNGVGYATLAEAFEAAKNGDTITLVADIEITGETYTVPAGVAIKLDMNGKKLTVIDNKAANVCYELFYIYGEMIVTGNGTIELTSTSNDTAWAKSSTIFHNRGGVLTIENGTFAHHGGTCMSYVVDNSGNWDGVATTTIIDGKLTSYYIAIRNRMDKAPTSSKVILVVKGGEINGGSRAIWAQASSTDVNYPASGEINISGGNIGLIDTARSAGATSMTTITGGTVAAFKGEAGELTVNGGTLESVTIMDASGNEVAYAIKNGTYVKAVASVNGVGYATLADALAAAQAGDTITLLADIYREVVTVSKAVTIDGAGKTFVGAMTLKADTTIKNVNFDGQGYNGYAITTRGANYLTIKDCTAKNYGYGFVQLASGTALTTLNNVTVSNMNYGVKVDYSNAVVLEKVNITAGVAAVLNSNYGEKTITIKNSKLNILATWTRNNTTKTTYVFEGANTIDSFDIDAAIDTFKLAKDATLTAPNTVTVVPLPEEECYVVEYKNGTYVVNKYAAVIGGQYYFETLADAFAAAQDDDIITLLDNITVSEGITNTKKVTLNLNGKKITGTDNATGSFAIITNKGELKITGNGTITLTATNNRGWSAYSSVISNTVGGTLIVENGTIEHLGGTDMAYAIDNLTNGKGTYAITVINGGTIKSTYRAIRMFLNGVEAQNILTINAGTIESTTGNKAVWMQDPSKNANTGNLTITKGATIKGDVYLTVTEGSTEWPVKVSIAASAVNGEVLTNGKEPTSYVLEKKSGNWVVNEYVAKVSNGKTTYYYNDLQIALNKTPKYYTVTLLEDYTGAPLVVGINNKATTDGISINLNGFAIVANIVIDSPSDKFTLTLTGGTIEGNITANDGVTLSGVTVKGNITVEAGCTIKADATVTGKIVVGSNGTLTIKDGAMINDIAFSTAAFKAGEVKGITAAYYVLNYNKQVYGFYGNYEDAQKLAGKYRGYSVVEYSVANSGSTATSSTKENDTVA